MDLIYASADREDIGVLEAFSFDLAYGTDENDFEIQLPLNEHCCQVGYILYIEGTEYGGIIDSITVNTETSTISYCGRTWHGFLNSKVIAPGTYSGNAKTVLNSIITSATLGGLFKVEESELNVSCVVEEYINVYDGLRKILGSEAKLNIEWSDGFAHLSVVPIVDYSQDEEWDSDLVDFVITKTYNKTNHLIAFGNESLRLDLYADKSGTISTTQSLTGLDEIIYVYETSSKDSEKLSESAYSQFEKLLNTDKIEIKFKADDESYDIGDIVGAIEVTTGIYVSAVITKKVVNIQSDIVTVSYEVGGTE